MIILTNSIAQTLAPGQSMIFDTIITKTGGAECFRQNSGSVGLVVPGAIYEISIGSNIGATEAGEAEISITANGSPLAGTKMLSQTAAAGDLNSVSRTTCLRTCCSKCGCVGAENIVINNTGTTTVNIGEGPLLAIRRVA